MLRFLLLVLVFYLLLRLVQGVLRYFVSGGRSEGRGWPRRNRSTEQEPKKEPREYRDVKDARFRDMPDDTSKPS
jgi:hypothetical protein